jgi:hypothetical protein
MGRTSALYTGSANQCEPVRTEVMGSHCRVVAPSPKEGHLLGAKEEVVSTAQVKRVRTHSGSYSLTTSGKTEQMQIAWRTKGCKS